MGGRRKFVLQWIGVAVAATLLAVLVSRSETHRALEDTYYDYWHVFSSARYRPKYTAFITVDDATLTAYKDDPLAFWAPYWGQLIPTLKKAGVKAIGLDYLYTVSAEGWLRKLNLPDSNISREYDSAFREALAQGDTILITQLVDLPDGTVELLRPPDDQLLVLPGGINNLGIANLFPDPDKYVRAFYPVMDPDPAKPGIAFNMQLALRALGEDPAKTGWQIAGTEFKRELRRIPIRYAGPPGTIPTISMADLLKPGALDRPEVKALKGKVAIVAANNAGTSDRHFTPYSRGAHADQMAGGEIHANIVETILSGRYPRSLPIWAEVLYVLAALAPVVWILLRLSVAGGAAIGALLVLAAIPPGYFAFQYD